jgi:hypothetical protein
MSALSEWIGMDVLVTALVAVHWWRLRRVDMPGAGAGSVVAAALGYVVFCSLLARPLRVLLCTLLAGAYVAVLLAAARRRRDS